MITYYNEESGELVVDLQEVSEEVKDMTMQIIDNLESKGHGVESHEENKYWIEISDEEACEVEAKIEEIEEIAV